MYWVFTSYKRSVIFIAKNNNKNSNSSNNDNDNNRKSIKSIAESYSSLDSSNHSVVGHIPDIFAPNAIFLVIYNEPSNVNHIHVNLIYN